MSSISGEKLKISVFGQSHSDAIGVVMDGLPAGESINVPELRRFMARRAPGRAVYSTQRKEADEFEILSGLLSSEEDGSTVVSCGAPVCAVIRNRDQRSRDYEELKRVPRPGHADLTAEIRYRGFQDVRGGGHFSGRLTAPLCFAGGAAKQLLEKRGIYIGAHIESIGGINEKRYDPLGLTREELLSASGRDFPVKDRETGEKMKALIEEARMDCDSVGGIIECAVLGLPAGLGDPMFDGLENRLAKAIFGIPAVKGLEFGEGFGAASMRGSEHNDPYRMREDGSIGFESNHAGGILGGISTGMPVVFRLAVKPTPSIGKPQDSVDLKDRINRELSVKGRHDPCIVPRAVPVAEAVTALVIYDMLLCDGGS